MMRFFHSLCISLILCGCAAKFTPEQLAKAKEIARDTDPDIYERYKGTQGEYMAKRFYNFSTFCCSINEPDVRPAEYEMAVTRLSDFYDQLRKADNWKFKPEKVTVPRMKKLPVIDGRISKDEWNDARSFSGEFIIDEQTADPDNTATRWFIGIGNDAFYVAMCCKDAEIIPQTGTNEVFSGRSKSPIYEGDAMEFFVRPDRKKRYYTEVQVNADGLIWPLQHKLNPYNSWRLINTKVKNHNISAKTSRTANGYQVEMRVPFTLLPKSDLNDFTFMLLRTHRNAAGKFWSSAVCPLLYNAHNVYGFIPATTGE